MNHRLNRLESEQPDLLDQQDELLAKLESDGRDGFTDDEQNQYDALTSKYEANTLQIKVEKGLIDKRRNLGASAKPVVVAKKEVPKFQNFGEFCSLLARKPDRFKQIYAAASGHSEDVFSDGGALVQHDFATEILADIFTKGELLSILKKTPVSGSGLTVGVLDENSSNAAAYWTNEAGSITASKAVTERQTLALEKLSALYYATDELLEDAPALGSELRDHFRRALVEKLENALVNGSGAGQPLGMLNSGCLVSTTRTTASRIKAEDIGLMWARMPAAYKADSVWLIHPLATAEFPKMIIGDQPVYMPPGGLTSAPYGTLHGKRVIECEHCAALGTVGDLILFSPSGYRFIEKGGIKFAESMHVKFTTDEMAFRLTYRCNGQPKFNAAIQTSYSPIVTIAT